MKSVASALVIVASAADVAVPVLVAPALVLGASTAARAETPDRAVSRQTVRYDDLNLASPAGEAVLRARVNAAAQAVCAPRADPRDLRETADFQACVAKAAHDALSALPQAQRQAARPSHAG
ncbi:MAG TPA: UrcA family protein [Caulobacteraceae bacterium]|nr:UrcA family protein [Caulobacteraceae bacterium]